ncbi:TPA: AAA family ATPase [Vibrio vulnificus]|nr:AAA family ATPase [Vibrio vulnificus]HAU8252108.1 AAA family ATPase [Vibrio vulnificus]
MDLVIISGGPGAGKTTLINALSAQGYMTFAEGSRTLIEEQSARADGILPWTNLPAFAELCLALMSEQKRQASGATVAFFDRAIPDIIGYLKMGRCEVPTALHQASQGYYAKVFVCKPESSIYVQDEVRPHTFAEALQIHQMLVECYRELGYQVVEVPWGSVAERVAFILQYVR